MMGVGGVVGGLLLSAWGGFKRRVHGVFLGMMLSGVLGLTMLGMGRGLSLWAAGAFASSFFLPLVNGSNQAIWQAKVAPDVQGRVFATRRLIAQLSWPIATILAGPMADYFFEPAMLAGGSLAGPVGGLLGDLVGSGSGSGMALMFVITGFLGAFVGMAGYAVPAVRNVEDLLPDYDAAAPAPVPAPAT